MNVWCFARELHFVGKKCVICVNSVTLHVPRAGHTHALYNLYHCRAKCRHIVVAGSMLFDEPFLFQSNF